MSISGYGFHVFCLGLDLVFVLQMLCFIDRYSVPRFLPRATSLTYGFDRIVSALWNMLISGYGFHEFVWEALC